MGSSINQSVWVPIFKAFLDRLPPSTNKLKTPARGKGGKMRLILTRAAREYRTYCYEQLKEVDPPEIDPYDTLSITFTFYLPKLENKGWKEGKTKYRYKRRDVSNFIKLIEDVICLYLGIDDSQFLRISAEKRHSTIEGVELCVHRKIQA